MRVGRGADPSHRCNGGCKGSGASKLLGELCLRLVAPEAEGVLISRCYNQTSVFVGPMEKGASEERFGSNPCQGGHTLSA